MGYPDMKFMPEGPHRDRCAPDCDDQIPVFSKVGRGLRGDGYKVEVEYDDSDETYLKGSTYDAVTGEWAEEWNQKTGYGLAGIENINGGEMMYEYNLRPYTIPQTFTLTLRHKRPHRPEWQWTTPAIPYIWDADDDGLADVDGIVGTGVSTLFFKKTGDSWNTNRATLETQTPHTIAQAKTVQEKLLYPQSWTRNMFNAPVPGDPWTVNIEYGIGGDIDAPNIDDLAKILGITVQNIRNIVANSPVPTATIPDDNLKAYIDRRDNEVLTHVHNDLGFGSSLVGDNNNLTRTNRYKSPAGQAHNVSPATVKGYIDDVESDLAAGIGNAQNSANNANTKIGNLISGLKDLLAKIPGASIDQNGNITIASPLSASGTNIAIGDINIYSGATEAYPNAGGHGIYANGVGTSQDNDIKAV